MSNHIHLVAIAGHQRLMGFMQALNGGFASWLNRRQERLGHVFAGRPTTVICLPEAGGFLLSYVANNPPRAGVVTLARESTWSAHRHYLQPELAPTWLDVERGLELAGFSSRAAGRRAYDDFVNEHRFDPRHDALSGRNIPRLRRDARAASATEVELAPPVFDMDDDGELVRVELVAKPLVPVRTWLEVSCADVVGATANVLGVDAVALRSKSRRRPLPTGRRIAVMAWAQVLNRRACDMAAYLGISTGSASGLLHRDSAACAKALPMVEEVVRLLGHPESEKA